MTERGGRAKLAAITICDKQATSQPASGEANSDANAQQTMETATAASNAGPALGRSAALLRPAASHLAAGKVPNASALAAASQIVGDHGAATSAAASSIAA